MTSGQKAFEAYLEASGDTSPYNYELFERERKAAWEAVADVFLEPEEAETCAEEADPPEQPSLLYKVNKGEDEKFRWIIRDENADFICDSGPFKTEAEAHTAVAWMSASSIVLGEWIED